jgi:flagellar hook-associated protein 2
MASVSSSTSSTSSIKGYGGLASGLDRDSLIEGMTASTKAKISKQQKSRQSLLWKQEAYQSVSSKLVEFSKKYTSYTNSSTNLSSPSFWARSNITVSGANSKYVSASGSSSLADSISVSGVKQLAKNASMTSAVTVSESALNTGTVNLGNEDVSNLEGQSLYIKYGNKSYSVSLRGGTASDGFTYDYSNGKNTSDSMNRALKEVSIGNGKTLADVINVTANAQGTPFELNIKSTDKGNNTILLEGGSKTALKALGFSDVSSYEDLSDADKAQRKITAGGLSQDVIDNQSLYESKSFANRVGGKNITFTYNGTSKSITFASEKEINDMISASNSDNKTALGSVATDLQTKLDKQFGTNRIKVSVKPEDPDNPDNGNYKLSFETVVKEKVDSDAITDNTSLLSISSSETGLLGKNGALKVSNNASNRLNLGVSLEDSGLENVKTNLGTKVNLDMTHFSGSVKAQAAIEALGDKVNATSINDLKRLIAENNTKISDKDMSSINQAIDSFGASDTSDLKTKMSDYVSQRELKLEINDVEIKGLSYKSTINEIMDKINSSDAGVKISYVNNTDKFSIQSTIGGSGGAITFNDKGAYGDDAKMLFGTDISNVVPGQDAIVSVKYTNSGEKVDLVRGSNTFNLDGLNITVNGTFGYDADGKPVKDTEPVTFSSKADSDKIVTVVSDMIKEFNDIIKLVSDQVSTKPNRDYEPLTDEQKEGMTEDQIKSWEDKAKAGMLFNDSDMRSLTDSMRFIFETGSDDKNMLSSFGITTSSTYGDNGKLVFDETKFRAALDSNPEALQKLFTKPEDSTTGEKGGVMARISSITNKYAATSGATKGILIEKAGSVYAPTSVLSNSMQKSIDSVDAYIKRLQTQLETETDRYVKQFTNLEKVISQMNSQSSWLNSSSS